MYSHLVESNKASLINHGYLNDDIWSSSSRVDFQTSSVDDLLNKTLMEKKISSNNLISERIDNDEERSEITEEKNQMSYFELIDDSADLSHPLRSEVNHTNQVEMFNLELVLRAKCSDQPIRCIQMHQ